jgi:hypothetical protein
MKWYQLTSTAHTPEETAKFYQPLLAQHHNRKLAHVPAGVVEPDLCNKVQL